MEWEKRSTCVQPAEWGPILGHLQSQLKLPVLDALKRPFVSSLFPNPPDVGLAAPLNSIFGLTTFLWKTIVVSIQARLIEKSENSVLVVSFQSKKFPSCYLTSAAAAAIVCRNVAVTSPITRIAPKDVFRREAKVGDQGGNEVSSPLQNDLEQLLIASSW